MRLINLVVPGVTCFCFLIDLLSKQWARHNLKEGICQQLIPGFIRLSLTTNTGGAFGMGREAGFVMTCLAVVFVVIIAFWIVRRLVAPRPPGLPEACGLGLLAGGALGNLADRLLLGRVTDFLEFDFVVFPVFNLADVFIDSGVLLILPSYYLKRDRKPQDKAKEKIKLP